MPVSDGPSPRLSRPRRLPPGVERTTVLVDQLLSTAEDDQPFDVIAQFARPLPAQIISEMIGVPNVDIPQLLEWSDALVRYLESFNTAQQEEAAVDGHSGHDHLLQTVVGRQTIPPW